MKHSLKNRILAAVFAACLLFVSVEMSALAADSGSCGSKAKWSLGADGTLSITGKGSMQNFTEGNMAPWYEDREKIIEGALVRQLSDDHGDYFSMERLNLLANLIADGILDIRIAYTDNNHEIGMYHEKMGLIEDHEGNKVAFSGSMNET